MEEPEHIVRVLTHVDVALPEAEHAARLISSQGVAKHTKAIDAAHECAATTQRRSTEEQR